MNTKKNLNKLPVILSLCFLILTMLAGCGTFEVGAVQPGAGIPDQTQSAPGETNPGGMGTIEIGIEPTPLPESASYTNDTYGFTFDYPDTWSLTEQDHGVVLQKGTNRLEIGFRWKAEEIDPFGRTGTGAGDFIYAGKVNFMNQVVPAEALLYEKKTKAVFYAASYRKSGLIDADDIVFTITLEDLETDYMNVDISDETIAEAAAILETFRWLDTTTGTETSTEPGRLAAFLKVQPSIQQGSGEPINLYFLLENHTQQGLYLLKWYTPMEGIAGDIFEVARDGQPLPYLGPLVSRAAPTPESYVFIEPDKSVTAEVDIAEAYDFSQLGTYTISFRPPRISHIASSEAEIATTLDELGPVNISSNEVTLEVVSASAGNGEPVRLSAEEAGEIISTHLPEKKPGLTEALPLSIEEVPDEQVWKEWQGQVFRVTEGIYKNESFLLLQNSVIQLGEALGGQGLTSLVVCDLDHNGQTELLFTYIAALGPGIGPGNQTRVGLLEPDSGQPHVIEANVAYLGDAALRIEETSVVSLNVVEIDQTTKELHYLDSLGYLSIEDSEAGVSLILHVDSQLPPEIAQNILLRQ